MLEIKKTVEGAKALFSLTGRLDTRSAPLLEKELKDCPTDVKELTLDFAELEYITSAGLRVLLAARERLYGKGELRLVHVSEMVMEVLEVTGFADVLTIE